MFILLDLELPFMEYFFEFKVNNHKLMQKVVNLFNLDRYNFKTGKCLLQSEIKFPAKDKQPLPM